MNSTKEKEIPVRAASPEVEESDLLKALLSLFSSMKTAILLLLLLAAVSIAGTVIEDRTGKSIYGTPWFTVLLALVGVNLTVCSVNRFQMVWRRTFHPDLETTPESVAMMTRSESIDFPGAPDQARDVVLGALRARSYRVTQQNSGGSVSIYATRGRAGLWGPHFTHISLLVIFAGAVFGHYAGTEGAISVVEGKPSATYLKDNNEPAPLGFDVVLRDFSIEYDKHRHPTGYKSDLQVFEGGQPVAQKVVDVNHPLTYKGMSFYQSDFGLVGLVMKVTPPKGRPIFVPFNVDTRNTPQGKEYGILMEESHKRFALGGKTLTLLVHNLVPDFVGGTEINASQLPLNPAIQVMVTDQDPKGKGLEAWEQLGWMTVSKSGAYKGYTVTLEKVFSYSRLQISRNPGLPVVYLGFALAVLGVILSFYVTHKIIRVSITPGKDGASVVAGATSRAEPSAFDKDFQRLRDALQSS